MKKLMALSAIALCVALNACTTVTDRNGVSQIQDVRMRMRQGQLTDVGPTNYGTRAVMEEQHPTFSTPANRNTTISGQDVANPTAGNTSTAVMQDAPARPQPAPTAGNMAPEPWFRSW